MKLVIPLLTALMISGCANTSGLGPYIGYSDFDQAKTVTLPSHGNDCSSIICTGLGAFWASDNPTSALLVVNVFNKTVPITGAEISIDGEVSELITTPGLTKFNFEQGLENSSKDFAVPLSIVENIINSKKSLLRVHTTDGFMDAPIINGNEDSKAYHALKRFLKAVQNK